MLAIIVTIGVGAAAATGHDGDGTLTTITCTTKAGAVQLALRTPDTTPTATDGAIHRRAAKGPVVVGSLCLHRVKPRHLRH